MREEDIDSPTVDGAVNKILELFVGDPRGATRVVYFDGWQGFGASTVLRAVADALTSERISVELHIDKVVYIDCSKWKSRRAMQRAIAVELKLGHLVMEDLDREDEQDDFNGLDEGSRMEILSVAREIHRALRDHTCMMIFHNGSDEEINVNSFGVPSFGTLGDNLTLWTFRRRFQAREPSSLIQNRVKNAHVFAYDSGYFISNEELFFPILHREVTAIASDYPCMLEITGERIIWCGLYELFLHLSFPESTEYDWAARASNYCTCDVIIQGDRPWEISDALHREIKWDLHPDLLDEVRGRLAHESISEHNSIDSMSFKYKFYATEQWQCYPWISLKSRSKKIDAQDMQAINVEASSCFLAATSPDDSPLVLADALFNHSTSLRVLHLSCCAFKFSSPPFIRCQNIRFLGLDRCQDSENGICEIKSEWEFLRSLWVLDLYHTDWYHILSKEATDLMINLWELNVEGATCSYTGFVQSQLPNLHKLRIFKPLCAWEASKYTENLFVGKKKLRLVDFSGIKDMKIIPKSLLEASGLEVLILDGCREIGNIVSFDMIPSSLKSLSLDGYGPASHWTPVAELPPKESRPSSSDQKPAKIIKVSLESCARLENLFMRGLPNLVELDLSRTAIKTLDFNTMVVETPSLRRVFLIGCERLSAIKWSTSESRIQPDLELLCIDTRAGTGCTRPSVDLNKSFKLQVHAILADARLARSLWLPVDTHMIENVYFNILITSSSVYSGAVQIEEASNDASDKVLLLPVHTGQYNDVMMSIVGDALTHDFPKPPTARMGRHIEIAQGSLSVESEMLDSARPNLGELIRRRAESVHVHDVSSTASMPEGAWQYNLKRCHVERCSRMATVFPQNSFDFISLETFWAADLLMARCIWSKGIFPRKFFNNLQHLHLRSCPRLQFVMLVMWRRRSAHFPSLETLHIIHCVDLKHVVASDDALEIPQEVEFPKLREIHLHDLPTLRQISEEVRMVVPALQILRIRGCWSLRRLPAVAARGEGEKKPSVEVEKDVWDALEWDGLEAGHHPSLFQAPTHSRYYRHKLSRGSLLR